MNFNQLRYIVAVDRHRSFSQAADECDVAQSTLSREVQRLEKEFNVMIFDRSRFPVVPTMKGVDLIEQAKLILQEHHHFIEIARKKDNLPSGDFNLGIIPGLAPYLLPLFTRSLSKKYPELKLKIFEAGQKEIEEYFKNDKLDAALTISPFFKQGFYEEKLFDEEFVLYLNENHRLAKKKSVKWKDIPLDELILQEEIKSFLLKENSGQDAFPVSGKKVRNVAFENGSLETIRKIIDINGGLTLLPRLSTIYMGARRLRMVREIESPKLTRTIVLVTPRGFEMNRITKAVKKEILSGLPSRELQSHNKPVS